MKSKLFSTTLTLTLAAGCAAQTKAPVAPVADLDHARFVAREAAIEELKRNFGRVHFGFDSVEIDEPSRDALAANVGIMRRFGELVVEIEGHCDELGSTEYNLALGQRRAEAIRRYMVTAGVDGAKLQTISYGEEKPVALGAHDGARAVNRRAEFRVRIDPIGVVEGTVASAAELSGPIAAR